MPLKLMFDAISYLVSPAERLKLLEAVIFNVLICNSDSHSKNYSVRIGAGGSAKIAPLYDLMCAAVYRQVDQSLPQSIAGRFKAPNLRRANWQALADVAGLRGATKTVSANSDAEPREKTVDGQDRERSLSCLTVPTTAELCRLRWQPCKPLSIFAGWKVLRWTTSGGFMQSSPDTLRR